MCEAFVTVMVSKETSNPNSTIFRFRYMVNSIIGTRTYIKIFTKPYPYH